VFCASPPLSYACGQVAYYVTIDHPRPVKVTISKKSHAGRASTWESTKWPRCRRAVPAAGRSLGFQDLRRSICNPIGSTRRKRKPLNCGLFRMSPADTWEWARQAGTRFLEQSRLAPVLRGHRRRGCSNIGCRRREHVRDGRVIPLRVTTTPVHRRTARRWRSSARRRRGCVG
jgi:hypothetical protein